LSFAQPNLVINLGVRPAAGIMGVTAHPIVGLWKSCQSIIGKDQQRNYQYSTRLQDGVAAFHSSTFQQRQAILQKFAELKVFTKHRRKAYKEAAERETKMWRVRKVNKGKGKERETLIPSTSRRVPPKWSEKSSTLLASVSEPALSEAEHHSASQHQTYSQEELDDMYQRDLDMAMKLSVYDQWGSEQWTPDVQEDRLTDKQHL
jgi:sterol 3beta-glucosyltransferase